MVSTGRVYGDSPHRSVLRIATARGAARTSTAPVAGPAAAANGRADYVSVGSSLTDIRRFLLLSHSQLASPLSPYYSNMSNASPSAPSVPLPHRHAAEASSSNKPPVWSINHSEGAQPAPLPAKCDRHEPDRSGVCCKELKGDDERTLIDPDVVRDV